MSESGEKSLRNLAECWNALPAMGRAYLIGCVDYAVMMAAKSEPEEKEEESK